MCLNYNESPDIIEIDAASNNGVDEIRELRDKVNLVPSYGKYKVYIIDEVHMLSIGAFNALLKVLEEPPKHVVFILCTTDPQKIPKTVLSRLQKFEFKRMSSYGIVNRLTYILNQEGYNKVDKEALQYIARLAEGGMRDAITLLDTVLSYTDVITIDSISKCLGDTQYKLLNDIVEALCNGDIIPKKPQKVNSFRRAAPLIPVGCGFFAAKKLPEVFRTAFCFSLFESD